MSAGSEKKKTRSRTLLYIILCVYLYLNVHTYYSYNKCKRNIQHTYKDEIHTPHRFSFDFDYCCVWKWTWTWSERREERDAVDGGVSDMCFPFRIRDVLGGGWFGYSMG